MSGIAAIIELIMHPMITLSLTATFNELMKPGTEFKANLNTNEVVTFKLDSAAASKTLTATYSR